MHGGGDICLSASFILLVDSVEPRMSISPLRMCSARDRPFNASTEPKVRSHFIADIVEKVLIVVFFY